MKYSLESDFGDHHLGSHFCCIYEDEKEQLDIMASFMSLGAERDEKCIYIVNEEKKKEIINHSINIQILT